MLPPACSAHRGFRVLGFRLKGRRCHYARCRCSEGLGFRVYLIKEFIARPDGPIPAHIEVK